MSKIELNKQHSNIMVMTEKQRDTMYYVLLQALNLKVKYRILSYCDTYMKAAYILELSEAQIESLQKIYLKQFRKRYDKNS